MSSAELVRCTLRRATTLPWNSAVCPRPPSHSSRTVGASLCLSVNLSVAVWPSAHLPDLCFGLASCPRKHSSVLRIRSCLQSGIHARLVSIASPSSLSAGEDCSTFRFRRRCVALMSASPPLPPPPPVHTAGQVYREVSPYVHAAIDGYNVCVMAYGQTGSGKTFTMEGPKGNPGVNLRSLQEVFRVVRSRETSSEWRHSISLSVVEIYNEQAVDLLVDPKSVLSSSSSGCLSFWGRRCRSNGLLLLSLCSHTECLIAPHTASRSARTTCRGSTSLGCQSSKSRVQRRSRISSSSVRRRIAPQLPPT